MKIQRNRNQTPEPEAVDESCLTPEEEELLRSLESAPTESTKADSYEAPPEVQQVKPSSVVLPTVVLENIKPGAWIKVSRLPSGYMGYPENIEISYRPYMFAEIDDISEGNMSLYDRYQYMIQGIRVRGAEVLDLYLVDVLYILLLRKISTLGGDEKFVGHYYYKNQRYTQPYHTQDLRFTELEIERLPVICDIQGVEMRFEPLTLRSYLQLASLGLEMDERSLMAATCINHDFPTAKALVDTASSIDVLLLQKVSEYIDLGVEPLIISIPDDSLQGGVFHGRIIVDDIDSLVAPFCELEQSKGSPIRFGC